MGFYHNESTPHVPYREIPSKIEGSIVWDMICEFVKRWTAKNQGAYTQLVGSKDPENRVLACFNRMDKSKLLNPDWLKDEKKEQPIWMAQLVRSAESCIYASTWTLDRSYEKSIHKAMLQAIHHAQKFIYIETQYFVSRSNNRIPNALLEKIIERHQTKQPFHVFLVLPSAPESEPVEQSYWDLLKHPKETLFNYFKLNPIRHLQWQTINHLIEEIEKNTGEKWENYLSLFLFGQWVGHHQDYQQKLGNDKVTQAELKALGGKQMIYVHSKFMNVDDKYIINGSANLNERSLSGLRDTEIAVYQWPSEGHEEACIADARQFRRRIWKNYFGEQCMKALKEDGFISPELPEHIAIIKKTANRNFENFMSGVSPASSESGFVMAWPFGKKCFFPNTTQQNIRNKNKLFKMHPDKEDEAPMPLQLSHLVRHPIYD